MKKKYLLLSVFVLTILLSGTASAEVSSTSTNKIGEVRQKIADIKQQRAEERVKIKAEIASSTANIKAARQELKTAIEIKINKRLDAQKLKIADEFEKTIKNLKDLTSKVESRIFKMESSGINMSSSRILLETAKTKTTIAETELANLENLLAQDIPAISTSTVKNTERKTILLQIKTQSEKTKTAIKTAHRSIVNVISSLKPGLTKKINSTSTPAINSTNSTSTNN